VIRQSCGCLDQTIVQAMLPQADLSAQTFFVAVEQRLDSILTAMQQALPVESPPELMELVEHFLTAFLTAMRHDSDSDFIQAFNDILRQCVSNESDALTWQQVISTLYQHTFPCFSEQDTSLLRRADNLWQLARLILGLTMQQIQKTHELDTQQQADQFRELGQAMITTFHIEELMNLLVDGLTMLQIPACYVALYDEPSAYEYPQPVPQWSRLIFAYNTIDPTLPHGRMELPKRGMRFDSQRLLPDDVGMAATQHAFVVEPLYFREQQIGLMLCQIGPRNSEVYDLLRGQISNALKGALLIQNEKKYSYELASAYEEIRILNESLKEENMRMSAELNVVRRLQEMILPLPEELQHIEKLDIVGYMQPADEVGGDYYDVLLKHGVLHIGIGDVTGHGLESGVLMLMTQTAIRTLIEHGETDPKAFLTTLNRTIYKNARRMRADRTLTFALINYQNGCLEIVGQHEEMLVARKNGTVERLNTLDLGFPIGLERDIDRWVAAATVSLEPGDGIVLYTDGVTEAENLDNEQYGLERLCDVVRQHWEQSVEEVKEAILKDVMGHIGKQRVYDDITLVVLKQQDM
jgi:serine phosphatase RsbU (regulator of sigma subunit)